MHRLNAPQDFKPYHVSEIPIDSREVKELLINIDETNIERTTIMESWQLQKAYLIKNQIFDKDFNMKREELHDRYFYSGHWKVRLGFLTAFKEDVISKLAEEGLEIKMRPYNYLGHNISGLHISMNADICLNEAREKLCKKNEIILLIFKYMLGRRKMVSMYDPKTLLAPTPNFDSHVCEERPVPNENLLKQYIESLVYLYEFASDNLEPVIRPRHCCPIGALILKSSVEVLDLTESDSEDKSSSFILKSGNLWSKVPPMKGTFANMNNTKDSMTRSCETRGGFHKGSQFMDAVIERNRKLRACGISVYSGIDYN